MLLKAVIIKHQALTRIKHIDFSPWTDTLDHVKQFVRKENTLLSTSLKKLV